MSSRTVGAVVVVHQFVRIVLHVIDLALAGRVDNPRLPTWREGLDAASTQAARGTAS